MRELARAYAALGLEVEAAKVVQEILDLIDHSPHIELSNTMCILFVCQWQASESSRPDLDAAQVSLRRLERADKQIHSPETAACLSEGRGTVALAEGHLQQAAEQFQRAIVHWETLGRPYDQVRALSGLGQSLVHIDAFSEARVVFDQALGIIETLATRLEDGELKTSFLNSPLVQKIVHGLSRVV